MEYVWVSAFLGNSSQAAQKHPSTSVGGRTGHFSGFSYLCPFLGSSGNYVKLD